MIVCKKRFLSPPVDNCIEVFIDVIEVDQEFQRHGIATELLSRVETWARGFGAHQMHAWSEEIRVEALSLWKKFGYTFSRVDFTRGDQKRYGFHVCKLLI